MHCLYKKLQTCLPTSRRPAKPYLEHFLLEKHGHDGPSTRVFENVILVSYHDFVSGTRLYFERRLDTSSIVCWQVYRYAL